MKKFYDLDKFLLILKEYRDKGVKVVSLQTNGDGLKVVPIENLEMPSKNIQESEDSEKSEQLDNI